VGRQRRSGNSQEAETAKKRKQPRSGNSQEAETIKKRRQSKARAVKKRKTVKTRKNSQNTEEHHYPSYFFSSAQLTIFDPGTRAIGQMSISIIASSRNVQVQRVRLLFSGFLETALRANLIGHSHWALAIEFVSQRRIYRLNRSYRSKPHITDILSFPLCEPSELVNAPPANGHLNLGQIFVCWPLLLRRKAHSTSLSLWMLLRRLLAHAFAHLLHFDHGTDAEFAKMQRVERLLLRGPSNNGNARRAAGVFGAVSSSRTQRWPSISACG
jgi:probable rRNA maturation factor